MKPFSKWWKTLGWTYPQKTEVEQLYPVRAECLVVEDSVEEMEFICDLLRLQNVSVTRAVSIAGALDAIAKPIQFQLAFVDLNLANSSAIEVVRRIKQAKRNTHCIIVSADFEKIQLCLNWGYCGILLKPFTVGEIRSVLRAHRLPTCD